MSLPEIIQAIAANPVALQPRARLAISLQSVDPEKATEVWSETIRLAISRGQFFPALFLCRNHIPEGVLQMQLLKEMAGRFGAKRPKEGHLVPPPIPSPRAVNLPESPEEQLELAMMLVKQIDGLGLPEGAAFPEVPVFGDLPDMPFVAMGLALREVILQPGTTFIKQGDVVQALYLLANGRVQVTQNQPNDEVRELAVVEAPAVIGEMSLLSALPRRANVTAIEPSLAWQIDAKAINELGREHPELVEHLLLLVKRRLLNNLFQNSELFRGMEEPEALLSSFYVKTVESGEEVFKQGEDAPGLFVILHGEAEVWTQAKPNTTRTRVATLNEGDAFGEMSLLTGERTNAAVWMVDGGVLLHLPTEAYQAIRNLMPQLESDLAEMMFVRRGELQAIASPAVGFEEIDDSLMEEIQIEEE